MKYIFTWISTILREIRLFLLHSRMVLRDLRTFIFENIFTCSSFESSFTKSDQPSHSPLFYFHNPTKIIPSLIITPAIHLHRYAIRRRFAYQYHDIRTTLRNTGLIYALMQWKIIVILFNIVSLPINCVIKSICNKLT